MAGYRKSYTIEEEKTILKYIFDNNYFHRLRGLEVFKEISRDKIPARTYQSLHERFRKHIIKNLSNPEYELSKQDQSKLKTIYDSTALGRKVVCAEADSPSSKRAQKKQAAATNFQDLTDSDSGNKNPGVTSCSPVNSIIRSDDFAEAGPSSRGNKYVNPSTITSNDNNMPERSSPSRNAEGYKKAYTVQEEKEILKYIFGNKCFYNLRGLEVWKNISRDRLPGRTYQSLHQRFRTYIIKNLQNPVYGLSMEDQMKLKRIYDGTSQGKRLRTDADRVGRSEGTTSRVLARDFHDLTDSDLDIEDPDDTPCDQASSSITCRNNEMEEGPSSRDSSCDTGSEDSEIFHLS